MKRTPFHFYLLITLLFLSACSSQEKDKKESERKVKKTQKTFEKEKKGAEASGKLAKLGIDVDSGIPKGIEVGEDAPAISGITDRGDSIELRESLKKGPLVLFFYRGEWCPICNSYLKRYSDSLKLVRDAGASVLGVTPERAPKVKKMRDKSAGSIPILPDTSYRVMEDYRVKFRITQGYVQKMDKKLDADITAPDRDSTAFLPVPATYLIDQDGHIAWRHFDPDYKSRASVKSILDALEQLES